MSKSLVYLIYNKYVLWEISFLIVFRLHKNDFKIRTNQVKIFISKIIKDHTK